MGGVRAPGGWAGALGGGELVAGGSECGPRRVAAGGKVAISAVAGPVGTLDGASELAAPVLFSVSSSSGGSLKSSERRFIAAWLGTN